MHFFGDKTGSENLADHFADGLGPGGGISVAQQRHGADLAGTVALLAVFLQQGSDVLAESYCSLLGDAWQPGRSLTVAQAGCRAEQHQALHLLR